MGKLSTQRKPVDNDDMLLLLDRLSQTFPSNLRVGSTSPFPSLDEFERLRAGEKCASGFDDNYMAGWLLAKGGASGANIYDLSAVNEDDRVEHLRYMVKKLPLVVKQSRLSKPSSSEKTALSTTRDPDEENFMDIVIGSRLNILVALKIAPAFMRTVDWFICHDLLMNEAGSKLYTITEQQDLSILKWFELIADDIVAIRSILAQLLYSLETSQKSMGFVHFDLHAGNVFVRTSRNKEQKKADLWSFVRPDGSTLWIPRESVQNVEPVMIDFGRSRLESPLFTKKGNLRSGKAAGTETLSISGLANYGITEEFDAGWDMRRFATDLVERLVRKPRPQSVVPESPGTGAQPPPQDFFETLASTTDPEVFEQFLDVLQMMAGTKDIVPELSPGDVPGDVLLQDWKYYANRAIENYNAQVEKGKNQLDRRSANLILRIVRSKGIRQLITIYRRQNEISDMTATTIAHMWSWTNFSMSDTPASVLSAPFFKPLYEMPSDMDNPKIYEAARYREFVTLAK